VFSLWFQLDSVLGVEGEGLVTCVGGPPEAFLGFT